MKLTEKQKRFCDNYIINPNATDAAIKAGYASKTAKVIGHENLTKPYIREYIDKRLEQLEEERIAKSEEVLKYLTSVMRGQESEEVVVVEGLGMGESEARRMNKKLSARDRIKAAELIGKRYGLYVDKVDVNEPINITIKRRSETDD